VENKLTVLNSKNADDRLNWKTLRLHLLKANVLNLNDFHNVNNIIYALYLKTKIAMMNQQDIRGLSQDWLHAIH